MTIAQFRSKKDSMMENIEELEVEMVKDEKGRVVWPFNFLSGADFSLNNIHIPSLKPGAVHGNHYHKYSTEYIFIMSGPCPDDPPSRYLMWSLLSI